MKTIFIFWAIINGYLAAKEEAENSGIEQVKEFVLMAQRQCDDKITKLEEHIREQDRYIKALKEESKIFAKKLLIIENKAESNILKVRKSHNNTGISSEISRNPMGNKEMRRLVNNQPVLSTDVAFTALMSSCIPHPSLGHTFIFDNVKTNIGSGYNKYSGHFMAPEEGIYVFSWTVVADNHSFVRSEIVINGSEFSYLMTDGQEMHDIHSASGLITVHLNHGDDVYIRAHSSIPGGGNVYSGEIYGDTSFSGWKI